MRSQRRNDRPSACGVAPRPPPSATSRHRPPRRRSRRGLHRSVVATVTVTIGGAVAKSAPPERATDGGVGDDVGPVWSGGTGGGEDDN